MTELTFKPTAPQAALIKLMTQEDRVVFDKLKTIDEKVNLLILLETLGGYDVKGSCDFVSSEAMTEKNKYPMIALGSGPLSLPKGKKSISRDFRLIGTMPMFSLKPVENWKSHKIAISEKNPSGTEVWVNRYFVVETISDTPLRFGLYDNPMLRNVLLKVPTRESLKTVDRNPIIRLEYFGILDKEVLVKDWGFECQGGNKAHAVKVTVEKGHLFDPYHKGCVNFLANPKPIIGSGDDTKGLELDTLSWERMETLNGNVASPSALIEGGSQAELAQQ